MAIDVLWDVTPYSLVETCRRNINKNPTRRNNTQYDSFYCKITLHVSDVHRTHHQEYWKLYPLPPVQVILLVPLIPSNVARSGPGH